MSDTDQLQSLEQQLAAAKERIAELERGLKFAQLERDNRTSAYEVGVKMIGELRRAKEAAETKMGTFRSETIQGCADWITETELALPIAWHMGTKADLVKKFALCLAASLRSERLDRHSCLCSEETLALARRDNVLAQIGAPKEGQ